MDRHVHEQWLRDYKEWKASDMSLSSWAREHGINPSTFRNRNIVASRMLDQAENHSCESGDHSNFVEVIPENAYLQSSETDLSIDAFGSHIEIGANVPPWQLKMVLEVLRNA